MGIKDISDYNKQKEKNSHAIETTKVNLQNSVDCMKNEISNICSNLDAIKSNPLNEIRQIFKDLSKLMDIGIER
jgi:methylthioribose-1-phosphate isomerase